MSRILAYKRKVKTFNSGVVHATLDPDGPGSVRLHLVPPLPSFSNDPPSLLIIDGTYFLTVGPSWAAVLRMFIEELNLKCSPSKELSEKDIDVIEGAVVNKVRQLYPKAENERILNDLKEIVTLAISIAKNQPIPPEVESGMTIQQYARYMIAPHRMDLIVAPMSVNGQRKCQLNCACCYADDQPVMEIKKELSTQDWYRIIDKCRDAGIPMLTFTGGEPLTRPDIVDLVKHAQWFVTRINTNAYDLTPDLAKDLYQASLDSIQITLYSDVKEIHDRLVGKIGAWDRTVQGIKNALNANLHVSINTPLVELNKSYCNTLQLLHEIGVKSVTCSSLIPTGSAVNQIKSGRSLDSESLQEILTDVAATCKELNMDLSFTSPGWLPAEELLKIGFRSNPVCGACLSNMAVAPNGDVVPCQSWLNGQTLGNILSDNWKKIWNHPVGKSIRQNFTTQPQCPLKEVSL